MSTSCSRTKATASQSRRTVSASSPPPKLSSPATSAAVASPDRALQKNFQETLDFGVYSKVYTVDMSRLTVSKLAQQVGTSPDTLRYYERIGLLPAPDRSPSGYRQYDGAAVERVSFIKESQRFGLRLEDIRELLEIRDRGLCPCGHTRVLLERRVALIDEEMAAMARLREGIGQMLEELPTAGFGKWQCSDLIQIQS